jgi:hypothetical protein
MVAYKYKSLGLDPDWATADNSRVARFTKLSPAN